MLDEIKEFKQLTEDNFNNNPWRLRDKNLKKHLSGLSQALEILARGFLFGTDKYPGIWDETTNEDAIDNTKAFIKSWLGHDKPHDNCKNYVLISDVYSKLPKYLLSQENEARDKALDAEKLLQGKSQCSSGKICNQCYQEKINDTQKLRRCLKRRDIIGCVFGNENNNINEFTCKDYEDLAKQAYGYHMCAELLASRKKLFSKNMLNDSLNDSGFSNDNSITYQKVISTALQKGPLKIRYLYSSFRLEDDIFKNIIYRKAEQTTAKKISSKDKKKILMLVAYYLIKCEENKYQTLNHKVILNKADFSNWINAEFESSNVKAGETYLDKFIYKENGEPIFDYSIIPASSTTKFKINDFWRIECGFELKDGLGNDGIYYKDTGRELKIIK